MFQKVKKWIGLGGSSSGKKLIINREKLEVRVALLEDGSLEEYSIERANTENIVGGIFKGKIKNIEPGLKAMFVDIGIEKNAFLHFWDAIPSALDEEHEEIRRDKGKKKKKGRGRKRITAKDIPSIYPVGLRGHRPGDQRPHRQQRPPRHHQHQPGRTLSRPHAQERPERHLQKDRLRP